MKGRPMKTALKISTVLLLLVLAAQSLLAQTLGVEWEVLNKEVEDLYSTGKYDRAVVVAVKALEVAEKNHGPDNPDVAVSLENLARLYRATKRDEEAAELEKRAARIRAINR